MPCDAAGALAIRSGEQHGLDVTVVTFQQPLDRSGRPMQAGSEIFRQRLAMREDLPLEGHRPARSVEGLLIAYHDDVVAVLAAKPYRPRPQPSR